MELIKPFIKYSRLYRTANDTVRKELVYRRWWCEIKKTLVMNTIKRSDSGGSDSSVEDNCRILYNNFFCKFCFTLNNKESHLCCAQCLFPLDDSSENEELINYIVISVCYYESINIGGYDKNKKSYGDDVDDDDVDFVENNSIIVDKNVWRERIRFAWYSYESKIKLYKIHYEKCLQCDKPCRLTGSVYFYCFSFKLFCKRCFFPLFRIVTANS
ncbi:ORF-40 peptide [Chrysodeixis chalcites nucleopolyhedrovirus]|uniref:ORF-40 peptide n=1 Tax=Chrysodeixis chalcites nucleopolyhedrovirus TaxID=320432 RepID=Q4KT40_9ABAC|nr:ORF-40 peptide [Chrysodeixis chalcites nucleopolyhedrovirus]AAY83971.1 ORF-40 peptide [Chrysodeixis chalcites nucleopolyhedrovirus]AGC36255.1 hypothetical protein TF1A_0040 [Chrysodeixis chalcites SNPV TF1-A]AGE61451.1 hypothetical protein [Chrysodeixis chalcites nucleopolyhedrovirus]AGE61600.1 hypothetical protein [Chrysodeixis chalcites nucleopolyhedrovirus]